MEEKFKLEGEIKALEKAKLVPYFAHIDFKNDKNFDRCCIEKKALLIMMIILLQLIGGHLFHYFIMILISGNVNIWH